MYLYNCALGFCQKLKSNVPMLFQLSDFVFFWAQFHFFMSAMVFSFNWRIWYKKEIHLSICSVGVPWWTAPFLLWPTSSTKKTSFSMSGGTVTQDAKLISLLDSTSKWLLKSWMGFNVRCTLSSFLSFAVSASSQWTSPIFLSVALLSYPVSF